MAIGGVVFVVVAVAVVVVKCAHQASKRQIASVLADVNDHFHSVASGGTQT